MLSMGLCLAAGLIAGMLLTGLLVAAREADDREEEWEPDDIRRARSVMEEALARLDTGSRKYGEYDPATDKRDLFEEAAEELMDCANYCIMQVRKLRELERVVLSIAANTLRDAREESE